MLAAGRSSPRWLAGRRRGGAGGGAPPFLIINQEQLLTGSEAGQALLAEEERERDALRTEARALDAAFEAEERRLTEQRPDLDPAEFRRLSDEFDARVVQARRDQDARSATLAQEFDQRRRAFYARVAPILVTLMDRYGAKAILDENSVLLADQSLNITAAVIAEIDATAAEPAPPEGDGAAAAAAGRGQRGRRLAMALAIDPALPQADILTIKRMIPHRYPFLLIDRVVNIAVNRSAVGIKNVTVNEPHFQGHFPVLPVMPGVLIIEAMAQTARRAGGRDARGDRPGPARLLHEHRRGEVPPPVVARRHARAARRPWCAAAARSGSSAARRGSATRSAPRRCSRR